MCGCGSESGSVFKNGGDKEKPSTAEQLSESEIRAYLEPFPRIANPDEGIRAVMSVIDRRCLAAAVACRDRYLASGEVARGAIQEAATWIFTQAKTGWAGKWPTRATPPRKESRTAQLERILKEEA